MEDEYPAAVEFSKEVAHANPGDEEPWCVFVKMCLMYRDRSVYKEIPALEAVLRFNRDRGWRRLALLLLKFEAISRNYAGMIRLYSEFRHLYEYSDNSDETSGCAMEEEEEIALTVCGVLIHVGMVGAARELLDGRFRSLPESALLLNLRLGIETQAGGGDGNSVRDCAVQLLERCLRDNAQEGLCVLGSNALMSLATFGSVSPSQVKAYHKQWGDAIESICGGDKALPPVNVRDRLLRRNIRIGYVSSDIRDHAVMSFLWPLLENHDPDTFEIYIYSSTVGIDRMTDRVKRLFPDGFRDCFGLESDRIARMIREDEIDVLVDLGGHTADHRLDVFVKRPAPVQISFIGYPATTGLSPPSMSYKIVDSVTDPVDSGSKFDYTERLIRPRDGCCFLCYHIPRDVSTVDTPGLRNCVMVGDGCGQNRFAFACFCKRSKITEETLRLWSKCLKSVTVDYTFYLRGSTRSDSEFLERLRASGINTGKVSLLSYRNSYSQYIGEYGLVDLCLDPTPYSGTTMTCEALSAGVPVLTFAHVATISTATKDPEIGKGRRPHVSNVSASILMHSGMSQYIANTEERYAEMADEIARGGRRTFEDRVKMAQAFAASDMCNGPKYCREIERLYKIALMVQSAPINFTCSM